MTRATALPQALRANALASLVTGLAGVLMSAPLAATLGLLNGTTYQVIGGLLVIHTMVLLWATGRANIAAWARLNVAGLAVYVIVLAAVLVFGNVATPLGRVLLAADALMVAALAFWQWRALSAAAPRPAQ